MDKGAHDIESLRAQYCPPLDDGLFYAISSDYNLDDAKSREDFQRIIEQLREEALQQQNNTDFDPSGTGGITPVREKDRFTGSQSGPQSTPEENSRSNGVTSITTGLSELKWDSSVELGEEFEDLPIEGKEEFLKTLFPEIHSYEISQILKKCDGSVNQAIDQLLNLSFLGNDYDGDGAHASPIPKGIDAFVADDNAIRKRKGRSRRKDRTNESSRTSSTGSFSLDPPNIARNAWTKTAHDVEFICIRTSLQPQTVRSVYHAEGTDISATIKALAVKESSSYRDLAALDPLLQVQIIDLKNEFQMIPESQLYGLLVLTRKIPSAAQELAEVMVMSKDEPVLNGKLHGVVQYTPLTLSKDENHEVIPPLSPRATLEYSDVRTTAAAHSLAASTAFSQASAAYRRGKSDRLMGGAAAYYAMEGHKRAAAAKEIGAAAADAHVNAHSTSTAVDLHGVSVPDAVRIARDRTQKWWEGLGDTKFASGGGGPARAGFRIVTGVGRHSKDGAPRIGPAVSKMLMREGWKVHFEQGEIMVYGKIRH